MKLTINFLGSTPDGEMLVGRLHVTTEEALKNEAVRAALGDAETQLKDQHGDQTSISRWTTKESK